MKKSILQKWKQLKEWQKTLINVGIVFVVSYQIFTKVALVGVIPSGSMIPTLEVGDIVVANGLAYKLKEPQRGDIIIFDMNGVTLIKRVMGVPGDSLMFVDGYLYLNGELVSEEYLPENIETNSFKDFEDIPDECYFVMGDNAIKNGATSVLEPELEPWGQRTCYIADPEGNLIEIGSWNMSYEEKDL